MPPKTVDLYKKDKSYYGKALPGEIFECQGTMEEYELNDKGKRRIVGSSPCTRWCGLYAVSDSTKPTHGRLFISCDKDSGGCGYFAFAKSVIVDDVPQVIAWQENFWEANKRKKPTPVPTTPIEIVKESANDHVKRLDKLEKDFKEMSAFSIQFHNRLIALEAVSNEVDNNAQEEDNSGAVL